jgi:hypothetical protein
MNTPGHLLEARRLSPCQSIALRLIPNATHTIPVRAIIGVGVSLIRMDGHGTRISATGSTAPHVAAAANTGPATAGTIAVTSYWQFKEVGERCGTI